MNRRAFFRAIAGGAAAVPVLMAGQAQAAEPIEATATLEVIPEDRMVMVGEIGPEIVGTAYIQLFETGWEIAGLPYGSYVANAPPTYTIDTALIHHVTTGTRIEAE